MLYGHILSVIPDYKVIDYHHGITSLCIVKKLIAQIFE